MNPTIEKIISMLFEDIIETEETHALHDEILNNCQERYQDMIARGVSEDEAIHAVMESLTGMDEVLAQYPRKTHEDEEGSSFCFDPARSPVRLVDIHLVSEDVSLSPSADGLVHIGPHEAFAQAQPRALRHRLTAGERLRCHRRLPARAADGE